MGRRGNLKMKSRNFRNVLGSIMATFSMVALFTAPIFAQRQLSSNLTLVNQAATSSDETSNSLDVQAFRGATVFVNVQTLTLPDADDEVDFFLQTTYDEGANWTDIQNIHFTTADNGNTAKRIIVIDGAKDGPGAIQSITGTDPAAGAEISETVPANTIWRLSVWRAVFVTDATSATRFPTLEITDGGIFFRTRAHATQDASATVTYNNVLNGFWQTSINVSEHHNTLPDVHLAAGAVIRTSTTLLEAGDNWGAPQYLVEAWHDPSISTDATIGDNLKSYDRPIGSAVRMRTTVTGATAPTYAFVASISLDPR